jgi:hypothetical protein
MNGSELPQIKSHCPAIVLSGYEWGPRWGTGRVVWRLVKPESLSRFHESLPRKRKLSAWGLGK